MIDTNEVKITGKVMKILQINDSLIRVTVSVHHEHYISGTRDIVESFVGVLVNNSTIIRKLSSLRKGDKVQVTAHLKLDYQFTSGGNRKEILRVYADNIEITDYRI